MAKAKKLPSGSWRVRVYAGDDETGKKIYKSFTAPTKKEAEYMAAEFQMTGKHKNASTRDITLREAYERYIESKSNVLSPSTVREYRRSANNDLQEIMRYKLSDLTPEVIQRAINHYSETHAPKTVRNAHALLSSVLSTYAPDFHLHTGLPQKQKNMLTIPSEAEVNALLQAAEGKPLHTAILLGAVGTLRRSEICALTKFDLTANGVMVNKAMVLDENKEWVIKNTKTAAGTRFVELPYYVLDELRTVPGDRVYPYRPSTLTNKFILLSEKVLGKKYRFHDLRHYSASVLHAMGVPDLYIMQRGGWESREVLNRVYQHVLSDEQKRYNEQIMQRFTDAFNKQI
ncbi:MAG: site-specific integrase [Clostridia bacterium]|nr:site-specific integrase [Clostridia bacterium]